MLPINVLNDLVRSYTTQATSIVPEFLAASFEMLRDGQSKVMENLGTMSPSMPAIPGLEAMQAQQEAFLKAMMGGFSGATSPQDEASSGDETATKEEELDEIKKQLAALQAKLSGLG